MLRLAGWLVRMVQRRGIVIISVRYNVCCLYMSEASSASSSVPLLEDRTYIHWVGPGHVLHRGSIVILSCHSGNIVFHISWFVLEFWGYIVI
jgi:hypothetical protein